MILAWPCCPPALLMNEVAQVRILTDDLGIVWVICRHSAMVLKITVFLWSSNLGPRVHYARALTVRPPSPPLFLLLRCFFYSSLHVFFLLYLFHFRSFILYLVVFFRYCFSFITHFFFLWMYVIAHVLPFSVQGEAKQRVRYLGNLFIITFLTKLT